MKYKGALIAATASLSLLPGHPAHAKNASQSDMARAYLRHCADCLVYDDFQFHRGQDVGAFLTVSPGSVQGVAAGRNLAAGKCFDDMRVYSDLFIAHMAFSPELLRGALFRSLYVSTFANRDSVTFASGHSAEPWHLPSSDSYSPLQRFGECVVKAAPAASRAAIVARISSDSELRAYSALMPHLAGCIAPGSTIGFSKGILEATLAEALYHLSGGVLPVAGGGPK